jgi:hypothetical protein
VSEELVGEPLVLRLAPHRLTHTSILAALMRPVDARG